MNMTHLLDSFREKYLEAVAALEVKMHDAGIPRNLWRPALWWKDTTTVVFYPEFPGHPMTSKIVREAVMKGGKNGLQTKESCH